MIRRQTFWIGVGAAILAIVGRPQLGHSGGDENFTIGGAVYTDLNSPLTSGIEDVEVCIDCPDAGFHVCSELTRVGTGTWEIHGVPMGDCVLDAWKNGWCFSQIVDSEVVEQLPLILSVHSENQGSNLSIQILAEPNDCGDGFCDASCNEDCATCPADCGCQVCDLCNVGSCEPLQELHPECHGSLWRSARNCIEVEFPHAITPPEPGQLIIRELLDGGAFGPDLSPFFEFGVEANRVLYISESGATLQHRAWYAIQNQGGWSGVGHFSLHYVVQVGDADANRFVTPADVGMVNASPQGPTELCSRFDIDGNGFRTPRDVGLANAGQGPLPEKPSGH